MTLLEQPTAAEIATLLYLPATVVELVLGNLRQLGGAASDPAGRWSVAAGAPRFRAGQMDPPIPCRTRRLLCYWPKHQVMLPVLPRMRLRDLVQLDVHNLHGEVAEWYSQMASWSGAEGSIRGRSEDLSVLPLRGATVTSGDESSSHSVPLDSPVSEEEVLVSRCRLDVIALTWASLHSGVWEVVSRLWSRLTPNEDSEGEPFAPVEPVPGLSLLEKLLGSDSTLDDLGTLFHPNPDAWRKLLVNDEGPAQMRRDLAADVPAIIVGTQEDFGEKPRWQGLSTCLAREARLLCYLNPVSAG